MKTICFINEKGGIGKTSTCFSLAWEMSKSKKILMIDLDGQRANLTFFCGIKKTDEMLSMYDALQKGKSAFDCSMQIKENLYIIPASYDVSGINQQVKVSKMKNIIREVQGHFDYCFIDVSPSPNWGQYLALASSDYAIIPMLPDVASVEADNGIVETIQEIWDCANPSLDVLGILFNRNVNNTRMSKAVKEITKKICEKLNTEIFESTIRNSVTMGECINDHVGVTEYDSKSAIAQDILDLIDEIEDKIKTR